MTASPIEQRHPHDYLGCVPERLPAQVVRDLSVLRPGKAISALVVEWMCIVVAIALSEMVRHPLAYVGAVIWIGARQHSLTVLGHDAAHYRLLPDKRWNDWIGDLATQWPTFLTLEGFRHFHSEHHRFLGTAADGNRRIWKTHGVDGDLTAEWTFPKTLLSLGWTILRRAAFLTGLFWIVRGLLGMLFFRRSWIQVLARLTFYGVILSALLATGTFLGFVRYWIVPYCTWHMACQYIRVICEHSAAHSPDRAYAMTRTTLARSWERWLIVPRNIHYHIEHHWYPSVPFYNLPALHDRMMAQPEFRRHAVVTTSVVASLRQCIAR